MGKNQDDDTTEYDLDRFLQHSFSYSDDYLLEEMEQAEEGIADTRISPASDDGFKRLMDKMEQQHAAVHDEREETRDRLDDWNLKKEGGRIIKRGVKVMFRMALAVGILGSVLLMTSIQAGAKRSYEYSERTMDGTKKNSKVINNEINEQRKGKLQEAYESIRDQIGIRVLQLGDKPTDLRYMKTAIAKRHATMYFDRNGKRFDIIQQLRTAENSVNIVSDRISENSVYNEWIDKEIVIEKAVTDDGEEEFSASFADGNAYYYLSGMLSEDEFKEIVRDLKFIE
ncbi:MAG: hypothetical protein RRZ63_03515 [Clostridium sp.]